MSEQFVKDEDGTLLRDNVRIRKRWAGFFSKLLNRESLKLDPTIIELFPKRPFALQYGPDQKKPEMGLRSHPTVGVRQKVPEFLT